MSSKPFHLYLSTYITQPTNNLIVPFDKTNLQNVTWLLDFNNLFRGENHKYKRCILRHKLISDGWAGADSDWQNYQGIFTCNMPSNCGSATNNGTLLNNLAPATISTGGTRHYYASNTLDHQCGVEIIMPQGSQYVTFSFVNDDTINLINNPLAPNYILILQFELIDPKEEIPLGFTF